MIDYLTFTYDHSLPTSQLTDDHTIDDWIRLARLYILGERTLDKCIRNAITSEFSRISTLPDKNGATYFMPTAASNILFDGTPEGSPIRSMLIDRHVFNGMNDWLKREDHPALMLGVAQALLENVHSRLPYELFRGRQIKAEDYFV